jgi:Na+-translocating ferredoxin:NAD+ oxidoreductase subunit B
MDDLTIVLLTLATLSGLGVLLALILYFVAQKFKVVEDPRIDEIEEILPGANCGGCGYPGCRGFAEACVTADNLDAFYCPVGGNDLMKAIGNALGAEVAEKEAQVAVVRCQGSPEHRQIVRDYDGPQSCAISHALFGGTTNCAHGCMGLGDCVEACTFNAIYINPTTLLPEVIEEACTACGACVTACPRDIIELRNVGKKSRRIYVSCVNTDKGAPAKKACDVACIGCGKCVKICPFDAITLENNLAYIDYEKCKLCRKCVDECPTNAILELNFPPKKPKAEKPAVEKETVAVENQKVTAPKAEEEKTENTNE